MSEPTTLEATGDAGGNAPVGEPTIKELKDGLSDMMVWMGEHVGVERARALDTFLARWDGQADDGRKHADTLGEDPLPFEGASDMRIRKADEVVGALRRRLVAAADRAAIGSAGSSGFERADMMGQLFDWLLRNPLRPVWRREWSRFANRMLIDQPAVCLMGVYWERELALVMKEVTPEALMQKVLGMGAAPDDVAAAAVVEAMIYDPAQRADALAWLGAAYPGAKPKVLAKALDKLARGESAEIPMPEVVRNGPTLCAHRFGEDIFFPAGTTDIQRAPRIDRTEWLTRAELRSRELTYGYDPAWIAKVEEYEAVSHLDWRVDSTRVVLDSADDLKQRRKGMFEVITTYYRAVDDDGVPAIYTVIWHGSVDFAAKDREIFGYKHGKYPFVFGAREYIGNSLLESRSVPHLVMSDQFALKLLDDSQNDHTQLTTVPPVVVSHNRPDFRLTFGPLQVIRTFRKDEVSYLPPPAYPVSNDAQHKRIEARVNKYFSLPGEGVHPDAVREGIQEQVDDFLPVVAEVAIQVVQLCQQYYSDEEIVRITGGDGRPLVRDASEIRGQFDLIAEFDARTLDREWLVSLCEMTGKYLLPWDTEGVIPRGDLIRFFAGKIDRSLARMVRPSDEAARQELKDEEAVFAKMMSGVQPPPLVDGQNYRARLGRLDEILEANPELSQPTGKITPISAQLIGARREQLMNLIRQQQNALTGATMYQPVLK